MNVQTTNRRRSSEAGVAMLIAIFVLLLIAVVGIALIVSSGTETALAGNYRSSTAVYYAALAGLEEGRGRLLPSNPNFFNVFPAPPGTPLPVGQVWYITNPANGEDVLTAYPDREFNNEFAGTVTIAGSTVTPIPSVSTVAGIQGPLYRWVRINAVTAASLNLDINNDGNTTDPGVIYYDGTHLTLNPTSSQALEITSLAVLPNGSQKMAQYIVAPVTLNFPAALTFDGNNPQFTASTSPSFFVQGSDLVSVGTCNPGSGVPAVGYTNGSLSDFTKPNNPSGIPTALKNNYNTSGVTPIPSTPDIVPVALQPNLQTVGGLNSLVQTITQNADVVVNGPVIQGGSHNLMPSWMSATNPATVVVNGDLTFNSWRQTGYGILLVTGKLTYDPDTSWNGIILVIGEGLLYSHQGAFTNTQIQGAVFLARTLDATGNPLLPSSAPAFIPPAPPAPPLPLVSGFDFVNTPSSLTNGIQYSSCWIQAVQPLTYKVLSFHEILQ